MIINKGTQIKTKSGTKWYVTETQTINYHNDYLKVSSQDGFETIVNIDTVEFYR